MGGRFDQKGVSPHSEPTDDLTKVELPASGFGGIDASIFPTFQVRSAMPPLPPMRPATPAKAAGTGDVSDNAGQKAQPGQPNRQGGK